MKLRRIFVALLALVTLGVSCSKEAPINAGNEIVVPEGMKYVSFDLGVDTKISANPVKWNSTAEKVAVIGINADTTVIYEFKTTPHVNAESGKSESYPTTTIYGVIDESATLYCVAFPYEETYQINVSAGQLQSLEFPEIKRYTYAASNGVAANTPYACKLQCNAGEYSAMTALQPLFSFINVTIPERGKDKKTSDIANTYSTSYADSLYIYGTGLKGKTIVDFSGENAVTSLKDAATLDTVKVIFKQHTTGKLPTHGYYLVPIVPGAKSSIEFKVTYTTGVAMPAEFADYTVSYGANNFVQGHSLNVSLSGLFIKSVTSSSATLEGTTLSLVGAADVFTVGKVKATDYNFGFKYREKDTEGAWTDVPATYTDGALSADVTVDSEKAYEVKAYAVAPNAIKNGAALADQTVEGGLVYSSGKKSSVVYTIDKFSNVEYNGVDGGYWQCTDKDGDYVYPSGSSVSPQIKGKIYTYSYYTSPTDSTPYMSGIKIYGNATKAYYITTQVLLHYGTGYIEFPAKAGYKVTKVVAAVSSSGNATKGIKVATVGGSDLGTSNLYGTPASESRDLTVECNGPDNEGVRLNPNGTWTFNKFEITYTEI